MGKAPDPLLSEIEASKNFEGRRVDDSGAYPATCQIKSKTEDCRNQKINILRRSPRELENQKRKKHQIHPPQTVTDGKDETRRPTDEAVIDRIMDYEEKKD